VVDHAHTARLSVAIDKVKDLAAIFLDQCLISRIF